MRIVIVIVLIFQSCGPTSVELMTEARSKMGNNDFADALALLNKVIDKDPKNKAAYNMRGIAKLELGQAEMAIRDFDVSVALDSADYRSYYNRGNAHYQSENFNQAILDYDAGLRFQPREADIYINRGNALVQLEQYDEAIYDYDFALKLENDNYLTHFNLARAYYLMDSLDRAKNSFEKCVQIYNAFAPVYYFLGMIAMEKNESDASCRLLQKASELGYAQANEIQKLYCNPD